MWTLILPIALKLIGWFLDAKAADKESRQAFLDFIAAMSTQGLISKNLFLSYQSQRDRNREELEREKNGNT